MFNVIYVDDFGNKHLIIANNVEELRFLKERFEDVVYQTIQQTIGEGKDVTVY